jgi:uncharacterized membrane protein YbhN (UPF0104 family)
MSFVWPVAAASVWLALIVATVIQMGRLVRRFCKRYPDIGLRELPLYLFSRAALEALGADSGLCRERKRFVALVLSSIGFWLAGVAAIYMLGLSHT